MTVKVLVIATLLVVAAVMLYTEVSTVVGVAMGKASGLTVSV
jgi:hypothetical protein